MLYSGRKFDIRVWVLFLEDSVFFYSPGYIRTSSTSYSLSNMNNYTHLTNNCLQKHGDNYGQYEDGNTMSFEDFSNYLNSTFSNKIDLNKDLIPRMHDLIIDVFLASKNRVNPEKRKNCFELLGFDFLIDEDFRIWLIEVNTNPYLGVANEYIGVLLKSMIDDLLEIVLDRRWSPSVCFQQGFY